MNTKLSRILIVDKNDGGSFVLNSVLSNLNYEVLVVNSFLKAIEYTQQEQNLPSLIIVDIQELSAIYYEFPVKFFERTGHHIPMIAHGVATNPDCIVKSIKSGYLDYFVRPMLPDVLRIKILNILKPNTKSISKAHSIYLNEESSLISKIKLNYINEYGIQSSSHFPIKPGSIVLIQSKFLKEMGLDQVEMKVTELKKSDNVEISDEYPYKLELEFIGLNSDNFSKLKKLATPTSDASKAT